MSCIFRGSARIVVAALLASAGLLAAALASTVIPADAAAYVSVSGSGSSWSSVALDQWAEDVRANGIVVNFNPDGSAAGRADYMANQDDFAASDPPFRNGSDKLGGTGAEHPSQGYSYVPDTAGGTAFMYHITVAGHLVTNLRLKPATILKIFTGQITNWDNPEITADYGARLPSLPITPVIRSDGSGATFFFTRWLSHLFPSQWNAFCDRVHPGISAPCGQTEFYPQFGNAKSENGSNNVATYITSSYGNGSIGYDEYAYALNSHYPVVKVLNPAGYYVLPTASNVAVALTQAIINNNPSSQDYLQQNLDHVYTYTDPRSYPLSSYSYLIVPRIRAPEPTNFSNAKGRTLSTFVNFLLCAGQQQSAALGYSPLPINLVKGGFIQVDHMPGHVPTPNFATLGGCHNPTFINGQNILLKTAPFPSPCDKVGTPLNCLVKGGKATSPGSGGGKSTGKAGQATATASGAAVPGSTLGPSTGPQSSRVTNVTGQVVTVAAAGSNRGTLTVITAVAITAAIALPPALGVWLRRRRGQASS
jgi:ABC-type phosphate transport system substrate-binding protein